MLSLSEIPISFGTDGWRGVLGVDFTLKRLLKVAAASAQELAYRAPENSKSRTIIIGYDRRFLAEEMAEAVASAVRGCDLSPYLAETSVPTPACSCAVVNHNALGALVVTASHNPPHWLGLKIKGANGGSVEGDFTYAVEQRLALGGISSAQECIPDRFDCRKEHLQTLGKQFDIKFLIRGMKEMGLNLIIDPMHGSASGCISELMNLKGETNKHVKEIRTSIDPLFGGSSPEPLKRNVSQIIDAVNYSSSMGKNTFGIVFDGDGDRIAAIDEKGRFWNTQLLMPLLIDHLVRVKKLAGCVIKTVSGSDLMSVIAKDLGREVYEMPVGFKYIASEMLNREVLIGGEESGGIGFGAHIPERDALYTALMLLEAVICGGQPLGERIDQLKDSYGNSYFDRVDLTLNSIQERIKFETFLTQSPPLSINGKKVLEVVSIDGIKLILGKFHWLMFRFSGTEPLLRIYSEAPSEYELKLGLDYAKDLLTKV